MAEKAVSAGVFIREKDLSFIAQGVSSIGATVIGPTQKGPALVPIICNNGLNDFYTKCGFSSPNTYVPRTVESYLGNASVVNVVRVLGGNGFTTTEFLIQVSGSDGGVQTVAALAPTLVGTISESITLQPTGSTGSANFVLMVSGSGVSCSLDITSPNYLTKVFGTTPFGTQQKAYVLFMNDELASNYLADTTSSMKAVVTSAYSIPAGFDHGVTPWIQSQYLSNKHINLFRFHNLGDGNISNDEIKVGIQDIKVGNSGTNYYGTFTVIVRTVNGTLDSQDLDRRPDVVETFANLTLDPNSSNYLPKRIGDRYLKNVVYDGVNKVVASGSNPAVSQYIRVELDSNVASVSPYALPYGYAALNSPFSGSPAAVPNVSQSIDGVYDARRFFGFDFEQNADNLNYLAPNCGAGVQLNVSFSLDDMVVTTGSGGNAPGGPYAGSLANIGGVQDQLKFIVPFQGGFDGISPATTINIGDAIVSSNVFGFDLSGGTTPDALNWKKAIDAIASQEDIDTNLLVLPGVNYENHTQIVLYAKNVCENRGDVFYIADGFSSLDTVQAAINVIEGNPVDSNYTAVYFPWVKVVESSTNTQMWVPPSVVMPGVFAFNDSIAYEWYAPAGLNRGGLPGVIEAKLKLDHNQRDNLYEARINPLATFPGQGVCAWGQKDLQLKASALDRINVRRLVINLKKFVATTSLFLNFEQNVTATRNRFLNISNPYFASVQQKNGLYAFMIKMDDSNNTADLIDQLILYGQIWIQPTKDSEFIIIDFNIMPTGATFPNA